MCFAKGWNICISSPWYCFFSRNVSQRTYRFYSRLLREKKSARSKCPLWGEVKHLLETEKQTGHRSGTKGGFLLPVARSFQNLWLSYTFHNLLPSFLPIPVIIVQWVMVRMGSQTLISLWCHDKCQLLRHCGTCLLLCRLGDCLYVKG